MAVLVVDRRRRRLVEDVLQQRLEARVALAAGAARVLLDRVLAVVEVPEDDREVLAPASGVPCATPSSSGDRRPRPPSPRCRRSPTPGRASGSPGATPARTARAGRRSRVSCGADASRSLQRRASARRRPRRATPSSAAAARGSRGASAGRRAMLGRAARPTPAPCRSPRRRSGRRPCGCAARSPTTVSALTVRSCERPVLVAEERRARVSVSRSAGIARRIAALRSGAAAGDARAELVDDDPQPLALGLAQDVVDEVGRDRRRRLRDRDRAPRLELLPRRARVAVEEVLADQRLRARLAVHVARAASRSRPCRCVKPTSACFVRLSSRMLGDLARRARPRP